MIGFRLVLLTLLCASIGPSHASPAGTIEKAAPLVIGETFTIESEILGETRRINVYLPPAYTVSPGARLWAARRLSGGSSTGS